MTTRDPTEGTTGGAGSTAVAGPPPGEGGRTRRRFLRTAVLGTAVAAAVIAAVVAVPRCCDAGAGVRETYAPLVYLASGDPYRPMSAETFVNRSRLRWSHDGCPDDQVAAAGAVDAARLGSGGYSHRMKNVLCVHTGATYRSNARTRPYDLVSDANEGFLLDLDNAARPGSTGAASVYVDYVAGDHLTYWFLYGFSDAPAAFDVVNVFDHEGDWERLAVRLDSSDRPVTVAYFQHNGHCVLPWSAAPKSGTHPVVYSARGTHASYATAGAHPIPVPVYPDPDDVTDRGVTWSTWDVLLPVRDQPWYGYGGAWGQVGSSRYATGPLGPSAFKSPVPSSWTSPPC